MSIAIICLLLKQRLNEKFKFNEKQISNFLINCIRFHGYIKEEDEIKEYIPKNVGHMCKLCNSSKFVLNNFERTCQECGTVAQSMDVNPFKGIKVDFNLNRGTIIPPGEVFVKITKDGKQFNVDLSKIGTWLNSDPDEKKFFENLNLINKYLDSLESRYNSPELSKSFDESRKVILTMWYNIINNK